MSGCFVQPPLLYAKLFAITRTLRIFARLLVFVPLIVYNCNVDKDLHNTEKGSGMFTRETLDFLAENRLRDSKEWFDGHRGVYKKYVAEPLAKLVELLAPALADIDAEIIAEPKTCVSRIYRDTRFSKDKSRYRDVMWCSFDRDRKLNVGLPGFFFELSPAGFRYGMGYCEPSARSMESVRSLILNNTPEFLEAFAAYKEQDKFSLEGDFYKKSKAPEAPEEIKYWLDRKNMNFIYLSADFVELFSDKLAGEIAEGFKTLAPMYEFLMRAEEVAAK